MMFRRLISVLFCVISTTAHAEITMERARGYEMRSNLGPGGVLNPRTSLHREWLVLRDGRIPVDFDGVPGIRIGYTGSGLAGRHLYEAHFKLLASDDLSAVEVRFVVLDVFGQHKRTLVSTLVEDIPKGASTSHNARWRVLSENEAATAHTSIAYVANVRAKDGRVYSADMREVLDQVRKVTDAVQIEQLSAERPPRTGDD